MIVPQFWAEARVQHRQPKRQITVRRFGWSDLSQLDAQANADTRVQDALRRILANERLPRREPKIPYNGADGVPIREEIISRHGESVITRNSYGALCLNSPNVFFADIDFTPGPPFALTLRFYLLLSGASLAALAFVLKQPFTIAATLLVLILCCPIAMASATGFHRLLELWRGGPLQAARSKIQKFLSSHPDWNLRIYQTPAGLRVMATHQTFLPNDPVVSACFTALGTDRIYAAMCLNQQCFRARLSPKPWRIGIQAHMRPRSGTWPVAPERLPIRNAWIASYEAAAQSFASCSFLESLGSGFIHPQVAPVQSLHDSCSKASLPLPLA